MEEKFDERKLNIIKATMRIIAKQGFHKVTFRQIAAEAGISPGTLYYYYNSKNLILYDIIDLSQSQAVALAHEMQTTEWKREEIYPRLMQLFHNQIYNTYNSKIFLHLLHESLSGDDELADKVREKYNSWLESFQTIIELYYGIPRGPMSYTFALIIEAIVDGMSTMEIIGVDSIQNPNVEKFFQLLFGGQFDELMLTAKKIMLDDCDD